MGGSHRARSACGPSEREGANESERGWGPASREKSERFSWARRSCARLFDETGKHEIRIEVFARDLFGAPGMACVIAVDAVDAGEGFLGVGRRAGLRRSADGRSSRCPARAPAGPTQGSTPCDR